MSKKDKDNRNYRIFRVEVDTSDKVYDWPKKITMIRFHAENDDEAYEELKTYRKVANKEYTYYVEYWTPSRVIRDGKMYEYDELDRVFDFKHSWFDFKYIRFEVKSFLDYWFVTKPKDIYYWFRDLFYLLKYKQTYQSSWTIDDRVLDVIEHNLPILKKNKQTLSWECLNQAIREKHGKDIDLDKFYKEHCQGYGDDIENRAIELEHEMMDKLLEDVKLYRYYAGDYELIDKRNKDLVEFDKKWRHTLPLRKGAYNTYDYKTINKMADKCWNRIWNTFQKYGRELND